MKTGKQILEETGMGIELPDAWAEDLAKAIDDNIKDVLSNGCSHVWGIRQVGGAYSPCESVCIYCGKTPSNPCENLWSAVNLWE